MTTKKEKLETEALQIVQQTGLGSLSFRTLATQVGIKSSSVHYHFPDKADLARVLLERYTSDFFDELSRIDEQSWSLKQKMRAFVAIFEEVARQDRVCLCGMLASEVEHLDEANRELLNQYFLNTEKWLTRVFRQHAGEVTSTLRPGALALALLSGLEGALIVDRVAGNTNRLKAQKAWVMSMLETTPED